MTTSTWNPMLIFLYVKKKIKTKNNFDTAYLKHLRSKLKRQGQFMDETEHGFGTYACPSTTIKGKNDHT
jgi:hypothetical protein